MSIHINPNDEAIKRLRFQHRLSAVSSVVISLIFIFLTGLMLALVFLPVIEDSKPDFITTVSPEKIDEPTKPKVNTIKPQPSAPSASSTRMIISNSAAPVAFELPEVSLEFDALGGMADDFGTGWDGKGTGFGKDNSGGFGSSSKSSGGIEGKLYDFKQKPGGGDISYDLADPNEFVDRFQRLHRARFSETSLANHFAAPNSLFLTHLAIPLSPASAGPDYFGAKGMIKPSGWLAHYRGRITAPRSGSYRFSGLGDDSLVVMIDGKTRLVACWPDIQESMAGRWKPTKPTGSFDSPFSGVRLVYGDWVNLKSGDTVDIDVAIGERPGGKVGFVLQVEEKGVDYRKTSDGRAILPLFTMAPISSEEKSRITREFGSYEFEWENIPIFQVR